VALVVAIGTSMARGPALKMGLLAFVAVGSHGLLDAMTTGGLGAALLWPFTHARYFLPWRPIPVAPIGAGMLSARGLYVVGVELLLFLPFWGYALWPRRRTARPVEK
jgi:inner membrane protein